MSAANPTILNIIIRMLDASQEHVDTQFGAVQRVARDLASLSVSFHNHLARTGMYSAQLDALERQLEEASRALNRTQFDLQQRLFGDVQALQHLLDLVDAPETASGAPAEALRAGLDAYCATLAREHHGIAQTLGGLTLQLRLLANNIEIAATHAGGDEATAPIDLFCTLSGLLRGLSDRLRNAAGDLQLFEQTQNGHAESLRLAVAAAAEGAAA